MASAITLKGIDQALTNLNYRNKNALKCRLLRSIRQYYESEVDVESLTGIDSDELIKVLWDTGNDPDVIKHKKRNLSSIKSTINAELKRLFGDGKNPDGVIIGPANIFTMSDEAKEKFLKSFIDSGFGDRSITVGEIADVLNVVNDFLSNPELLLESDSSDNSGNLDKLKDLISELSQKVGRGTGGVGDAIGGPTQPTSADDGSEEGAGTVYKTIEEVEAGEAVESPESDEDLEVVEIEDDIADDEVEELEEDVEPLEEEDILEEVDLEEAFEEVDIEDDVESDEIVEDAEGTDPEESAEAFLGADELEESDIIEELQEVDADEDDDIEDLEEDVEPLEEDEIFEEVDLEEEVEAVEADDVEEIDVLEEEESLNAGILAKDEGDEDEEDDEIRDARLLADQFDSYLATIDRNYNQYILIPGGDYTVGSKEPKGNERPERKVRSSPFYMGQYPVTNALFEIFVDKTGYETTAEKLGYGTVYYGRCQKIVDKETGLEKLIWNAAVISKIVEGACWYQPLGPGSTLHNKRNHPVVQVSRKDAMAFAAWTGKRLPTEDEWEAASRTANGYLYPWGNGWEIGSCNIEDSNVNDTTSVDKFKASKNAFEVFDTIGNVFEWTLDKSESDSQEESDPHFQYYIVKGGSWISGNEICLFDRFKFTAESHSNALGFRCVAY